MQIEHQRDCNIAFRSAQTPPHLSWDLYKELPDASEAQRIEAQEASRASEWGKNPFLAPTGNW